LADWIGWACHMGRLLIFLITAVSFTWRRKQIQFPKRRVSTLLNTGRWKKSKNPVTLCVILLSVELLNYRRDDWETGIRFTTGVWTFSLLRNTNVSAEAPRTFLLYEHRGLLSSRPTLGSTHPPILWAPGAPSSSLGRPGHEGDRGYSCFQTWGPGIVRAVIYKCHRSVDCDLAALVIQRNEHVPHGRKSEIRKRSGW
jgi:hypothetical protein